MESIANDMLEIKPHAMIAVPRFFEKVYSRIKDRIEHSSFLKKKIFQFALKIGQKSFEAQHPLNGFSALKLKLADKLVFQKIKQSTGGRLKFFVSGGAALSPEIAAFFNYVGLPIYEGYGQTESGPVLTSNPEGQLKLGSIGKALPGVTLKVAEDGELLAQGPNVMKGYFNDAQATAEAIDAAGWLHTGDIARVDEDGYYFIIDRKKEMIVMSNGKKVAPAPIENKINLCPYIVQSNLIGEQKNYITALIVPDFEKIKKNNPDLLPADFVNNSGIKKVYFEKEAAKLYEYLMKEISQLTVEFGHHEQVKKILILKEPFTEENRMLTPSQKVVRHLVKEKYKKEIDALYQ
jgi:long-chain acyl-CoA synthetase